MLKTFHYLTIIALLFFTRIALASPDYEAQLAHQMPRFLFQIDALDDSNKMVLWLVFLTEDHSSVQGFASELGSDAMVEEGKWLGYRYRVSAPFYIDFENTDMRQWLRKYFFLGIAYKFDLDGWELRE